jgi:hypothetical protein
MEKHGEIRVGLTPPEVASEKTAASDKDNKKPDVAALDADFRKRAAEVVADHKN